jgi:hypothetical protein
LDVRLRSRRSTRNATATETIDGDSVVLPEWCPQCGGAGYLDSINLIKETKVQSCQECGMRWEAHID